MHQKSRAVFVCDSQPPHMAEVIGVMQKINDYEKFFVCVSANEKVIPVEQVMIIWKMILRPYSEKAGLSSCTVPFHTITELPELFKGCTVLTIDKKTFVHLSSLQIDVLLVPRIKGYEEVFLRASYRQGKALEFVNKNLAQIKQKV